MDCRSVLETISRLLPSLPAVEDQLVTFDALLAVSQPEHRADAARMLREAASTCADESRRHRLLSAAEAVAGGQPCAFTPEGLSARQAAAAQTVTQEEWEERIARSPLPPPPGESASYEESDEDEDDEEAEEAEESAEFLEQTPPPLPHLPVRHLFPGALLRVAQEFTDAQGRRFRSGERLKVAPTLRLTAGDAVDDAVIENAGNAWLQPVPSVECLRNLWEAIDTDLAEAEEDEEMDRHLDRLETLRGEVDACLEWLDCSDPRGDPPDCRGGPLGAGIFGRGHAMACRVPLLFARIKAALPGRH